MEPMPMKSPRNTNHSHICGIGDMCRRLFLPNTYTNTLGAVPHAFQAKRRLCAIDLI